MKKFNPVTKFPHMIHGGDYNPDQWQAYPEILKEDVRLMNIAGINSASVAIFAWSALEPTEGNYNFTWLDETIDRLYKNGVYTILATPSGARPAWMDEKYPEVLRVEKNRVKNLHGQRHNHCYTSPYYREKTAQMNKMLAERYKDHEGIIMWHISNEYGGECHCELCQDAFRTWLKEKYDNDIEKLNHAWWTYFWSHRYTSFDQIESPAPHGECQVHAHNLDWMRFVTYQTNEFMKNEIKPLKEITPNIPVTTNFMGTYPGLDYWKMKDDIDVISWDSYPRWHNNEQAFWETGSDIGFVQDINRSLKAGKPFMLMESTPSLVNWTKCNKLKEDDVHLLSSLQAVAHGSDTVQYFQFRKSRGASEKFHGAVVDHVGHEHTRVFKEVTKVGDALKKLDDVVGTSIETQVAVIYDWNNRWAIDDVQAISVNRKYEETCKEHYKAFWKRGIACDVIDSEQPFENYKVVVAPMLYMLKKGVADRLKDFVANGGTLITTYFSGYVDDTDLCFLGGFPGDGLGEVIGVWAEEIDALYDDVKSEISFKENTLGLTGEYCVFELCEHINTKGADVLATYTDGIFKDMPAITKNSYKKGAAYHIAARTGFEMLDNFYGAIAADLDLRKGLNCELPLGVSAQIREDENNTFVFVMNYNDAEEVVCLDKTYTDILTNQTLSGSVKIKPYGVWVLK